MFHQKQSIRPIQQINQEKCLNCNKLISQSLIRNHQAICAITISNKDQELLDEQLAMLIQQNKIESKIFLLPNPSDPIQQIKTQQEIQIQNKEVPSQIKQVFQSNNLNGQNKDAIFRQEQREYKDDLNFQKNELKNKHNFNSQEQIEKNIQKNDLNSQQIQQNMVFNTVQSQAQTFKNSQKCTIQNSKQQEAAQKDFDYVQNNSIQKNLENQLVDNPQIIVQQHNNQISRNLQVEKQKQVQNYPQNNYCQMKNEELIKQKQISDEKKLENGQFDKANQLNQFNGFHYEQINQIYTLNNPYEMQSLKDKQQNQDIHQQQQYQMYPSQAYQYRKPRVIQAIPFEQNNIRHLQSQKQQQQQYQQQYQQLQQKQQLQQQQQQQQQQQLQQQQQQQQQQQKQQLQQEQQQQHIQIESQQLQINQSLQQNQLQFQPQKQTQFQQHQKQQQQNRLQEHDKQFKQDIKNIKIKQEEPKNNDLKIQNQNNQDNFQYLIAEQMVLEERPQIQKVSIDYKLYQNSKKIEPQVQQKQTNKQSQKQPPSRQEQVKKKKDNTSNKNRKANQDKINLQFEYKPGMVITDDLVNQLSPEQIYELFTQLDLDNQVGLESKIFNLDMKRVQINATDNCTICMEDIQPQKEAADIRLDCNHQFHYDCIKQWLLKSKFCPVCKEDVDLTNYQYLE